MFSFDLGGYFRVALTNCAHCFIRLIIMSNALATPITVYTYTMTILDNVTENKI